MAERARIISEGAGALPLAAACKVVIREVWLGARVTAGTPPQMPKVNV